MTKSPRKNVPDVGIELGATCMPSEHASDRATAPGVQRDIGRCCASNDFDPSDELDCRKINISSGYLSHNEKVRLTKIIQVQIFSGSYLV